METKELKIQIPEGQEIDWSESAKQEKIVFKKIDNKPRSWEEYCSNLKEGFYFGLHGEKKYLKYGNTDCESMKTFFLDPYDPKAFEALMQLMSLRQAWVGDWEPDWSDDSTKWNIGNYLEAPCVYERGGISTPLSFPTKEMAEDFLNTFRDLLEIAKPLI